MGYLWTALITLAALISGLFIMRLLGRAGCKGKIEPILSSGTLYELTEQLDQGAVTKVLKHFDANFIDSDRISWQVSLEGIVAKFEKDEIPHFVNYKLDGEWNLTLLSHPGECLPKDFSQLIRTKFASYTVTRTEEILFSDNEDKTYILHLLKGNNYKEVVIENNEMIVISERNL